MPADLMRAVNHAHAILQWQENLTSDEVPPEWMWSLDEELEEWFDGVAANRRERYGLPDSRQDEKVPMMSNDLAEAKRKKARARG